MAELTVPQIDFSSLGQLPQLYRQGQQQALRQQTLAGLGQGGQADVTALLRSGDLSLAQLGVAMQNRQEAATRDARDFGFRQQEAQRAQSNADRAATLAAKKANEEKWVLKEDPNGGGFVRINQLTGEQARVSGATDTTGNPFAYGKQNEGQSKDSGYANRMFQSEGVLRDPALMKASQSMFDRVVSRALPGDVSNRMVSEGYQKYDQAARDFINATLRRESGAAISQSEFDNAYTQYLPRPGDTPEVLQQKQKNRQATIAGIAGGGGKAYRPPFTFGENGELVKNAPAQGVRTAPSGPVSKAQYDALPSGTTFTAPDGSQRIKP